MENNGTDQTDRIGHPVEEMRKVPKETCHERHTVEKENMGDDHPVRTDVDKGCRRVGQHDHPVGLVTGIKPVGFVTGMKYDSLAVGVTDDDPEVHVAVSSAPTFTEHSVDTKNIVKRGPSKTGVKNMIDQYLVKIDKGAATMIARKSNDGDGDRNEHPVGEEGTRGFGAHSRKIMPATPGTSTGGGVAGIKNTNIFKKKQTIMKKKETTLKKKKSTNFTPTKEKIFHFFEQQGGQDEGEKGVLRSSPIVKRKSTAKLSQESQLHREVARNLPQVELKTRPGPASMERKPQN